MNLQLEITLVLLSNIRKCCYLAKQTKNFCFKCPENSKTVTIFSMIYLKHEIFMIQFQRPVLFLSKATFHKKVHSKIKIEQILKKSIKSFNCRKE